MRLNEKIRILIETSQQKIKPRELLALCNEKSMRQTVYHNYFGEADYDNGFSLGVPTSSGNEVILEIIEAGEDLFQSGIRIIYDPPVSEEKLVDDFNYLNNVLMEHYGSGEDIGYDDEGFFFSDDKTYCTLKKFVYNDLDFITITISNIEIWEKFN